MKDRRQTWKELPVHKREEIKQQRNELRKKWCTMSPAEHRSARDNLRQRREVFRLQRR